MSNPSRIAIWVFCACLTVSMLTGAAAYRLNPDWFSEPSATSAPKESVKVGETDIAVKDMKFTPASPTSQTEPSLPKIGSLEELMGYLKQNGALYTSDMKYSEDSGLNRDVVENGSAVPSLGAAEAEAPAAAPAPGNAASDTAGDTSHSSVNSQVDGVAEGDIAITDGEYIYTYVQASSRVVIVRADGAQLRQVASIPLPGTDDKSGAWLREMYIVGDYLVTVSNRYENFDGTRTDIAEGAVSCIWYPSRQFTQYAVYDVSNRESPVQNRIFEVEGNPVATRMIGTDLYFVSSRYIYAMPLDDMGEGDILPLYRDTAVQADYQAVPAQDIYYFPESQDTTYLLVGAFDVTGDDPVQMDSYLGAGESIYMSAESLYVARTDWKNDKTQTRFFRFSVEGSSEDGPPLLRYASEGAATGYLLNQYSMDEYDGVFRVALTDWNSGNYVYTFDTADMQGLGRTEALAPDEQIKSVRFMGSMGYVVTFRQTDPLFTIDLSDPRKPTVLGQLKIPGFSSYLHPLGDGLMIGFGRNVKETYFDTPNGGREVAGTIDLGVKISLFDLSDPANPKEIDVLELERDSWCSAFDNPRAIMVDQKRDIFGFALNNYGKTEVKDIFTYRLIGVRNRRLVDLASLNDSNGEESDWYYKDERRMCYISGTLYTVSSGTVTAFDYTSFKRLSQLRFTE